MIISAREIAEIDADNARRARYERVGRILRGTTVAERAVALIELLEDVGVTEDIGQEVLECWQDPPDESPRGNPPGWAAFCEAGR